MPVDTFSDTGTSSPFDACTVSTAFPATQRVGDDRPRRAIGSASFTVPSRASWRLSARSGASIWFWVPTVRPLAASRVGERSSQSRPTRPAG